MQKIRYFCHQMNEGRIYHILLMAAYLWPKGQQVQKDPVEYIRSFIEKNYGVQAGPDALTVLNTLREQNELLTGSGRKDAIDAKLLNAAVNFVGNPYESSMALLAFYIGLAYEIWGASLSDTSLERLYTIARLLGLQQDEVDILLDMTKPETGNRRTAALSILGLQPDATEQDIKTAYRRLSLKYHPDRNVDKSDMEKEEAERKFKEIVAAKQILDSILES